MISIIPGVGLRCLRGDSLVVVIVVGCGGVQCVDFLWYSVGGVVGGTGGLVSWGCERSLDVRGMSCWSVGPSYDLVFFIPAFTRRVRVITLSGPSPREDIGSGDGWSGWLSVVILTSSTCTP